MTFRHIEAFRAVMATGSMTEASRRLHTSQPQVSRLIGQLEGLTGLPLFDRGGSRLTPTLDGTRFHAEVERAFVGLSAIEAAAARIRAFGAERLRVAAMPRLAGGCWLGRWPGSRATIRAWSWRSIPATTRR